MMGWGGRQGYVASKSAAGKLFSQLYTIYPAHICYMTEVTLNGEKREGEA